MSSILTIGSKIRSTEEDSSDSFPNEDTEEDEAATAEVVEVVDVDVTETEVEETLIIRRIQ